MNTIKNAIVKFSRDEEGAQVVEYALIIAVVSMVLVVALGNAGTGITSKFAAFVTRVGTCLSGGAC